LTNAIATDRLRYRLLLIGGMGVFLVVALERAPVVGSLPLAEGAAIVPRL
jgi:hypothetical protein